eukprot:CAMPEP_0117684212 /NCGR_PEP_ID=MMETSP0804-20121206/20942_1 /TAXON_ID=1074897 /ORGANISM="Tetraselmis astigmatica, Strain CCMP880" /LENGTH=201 /DNA_ID=CAMNT_0005495115 /DNA_START=317 /DNA_END=918 /DNA_ORIENTATION=+
MMSQQLLGGGIALSGAGLSRRHLSATSAAVRVDPVRLFPSMVPGATSSNRWSSRAGLLARAQKEGGNAPADGTSKTLANIDNLLGLEPEPEPEPEQEPAPAPEPVNNNIVSKQPPRKQSGSSDWILDGFEEDGVPDVANRSLSSVSYVLPLLDGLHYAKFILLQAPQFALVLLPLAPAIELFEEFRWLQIVFFFALALGVA